MCHECCKGSSTLFLLFCNSRCEELVVHQVEAHDGHGHVDVPLVFFSIFWYPHCKMEPSFSIEFGHDSSPFTLNKCHFLIELQVYTLKIY